MALWGKKVSDIENDIKEIEEEMKNDQKEESPMTSVPPITTASQPVRDGGVFDEICRDIMKMHSIKNDQYASSPVDELSISAWKYQIQIKATRALRANTPEKLKDELLDTAVYCILLLEKMRKEGS